MIQRILIDGDSLPKDCRTALATIASTWNGTILIYVTDGVKLTVAHCRTHPTPDTDRAIQHTATTHDVVITKDLALAHALVNHAHTVIDFCGKTLSDTQLAQRLANRAHAIHTATPLQPQTTRAKQRCKQQLIKVLTGLTRSEECKG